MFIESTPRKELNFSGTARRSSIARAPINCNMSSGEPYNLVIQSIKQHSIAAASAFYLVFAFFFFLPRHRRQLYKAMAMGVSAIDLNRRGFPEWEKR